MEFGEKLQALRRVREMTQEELAHALYVSRTAISKWESGRGYPNIDSLKAISKYFAVSIDELLSGDALLSIAEDESREREARLRSLTFGLLDCAAAMLLFLPFFADRTGGAVRASALLSLSGAAPYVRAAYLFIVSVTVIWSVLTLSLQNCRTPGLAQVLRKSVGRTERCGGRHFYSGDASVCRGAHARFPADKAIFGHK